MYSRLWPRLLIAALLGVGGIVSISLGVTWLPEKPPPLDSGIAYPSPSAYSDALREAQLHSLGFYLICGGSGGFAASILYMCFVRCCLVPKWNREEQADHLAQIEAAMFRSSRETRVRVAAILPAAPQAQPVHKPEVRWLAPSERS